MLGVAQGHLSLFAKINDAANKVKVIIDKRLMDAEKVLLHPLDEYGVDADLLRGFQEIR